MIWNELSYAKRGFIIGVLSSLFLIIFNLLQYLGLWSRSAICLLCATLFLCTLMFPAMLIKSIFTKSTVQTIYESTIAEGVPMIAVMRLESILEMAIISAVFYSLIGLLIGKILDKIKHV